MIKSSAAGMFAHTRAPEGTPLMETKVPYEYVEHPPHYQKHPAGIECIAIIQHFSFNIGTAVKHLWRAGLKPNADSIEDLRKSIQYIEFEIKRLEKNGL